MNRPGISEPTEPDFFALSSSLAAFRGASGIADSEPPPPDRSAVIGVLEEIDLAMFPCPARRETSETLLREIHRRLAREIGAALRMVGRGDRTPAAFEARS